MTDSTVVRRQYRGTETMRSSNGSYDAGPTLSGRSHTAATGIDAIYRAGMGGIACWVRNHHGQMRDLPMNRWIGGHKSTADDHRADEEILAHCDSRLTLDLGCGPGRFAASLHQRGTPVLGVDESIAAVEITRARGGTAVRRGLFTPLPAEGRWDRVLLADGNIGIGGDPVRTLTRVAQLLAPGGVVIAEIDRHGTAVCREMLRWETDQYVSQWFAWARVGARVIDDVAGAAGLAVTTIAEIHDRVIAVLAAPECAIGR